jgi:hypothetical protein
MQCLVTLAASSYSSAAAYPSSLPTSYPHNSFPSLPLPMPIPGQSDAFELEHSLNSAFWVLSQRGMVQYTADKATTQLVMLQNDVIGCTFSHSK